jgi:polyhydroxyalkanoate synthase
MSPVALALATMDWALHLSTQPAQAALLGWSAWQRLQTATEAALRSEPPQGDARFAAPAWRQGLWPWLSQAHQAAESWWSEAADLRGVQPHHRDVLRFFAARWLDTVAPGSLPLTHPEVIERSLARHGANLLEGAAHAHDAWRKSHGLAPLQGPAADWRPGIEVAATPGKVVHRNHLVELIQYLPSTARVRREPLLIVPSWIMKYYILDLAPARSMVRWLVDQGHTVFMLSWRNPDASDAALTMDDYLELGLFDSLSAIGRLLPGVGVHACGYCLGGTMLSLAAAALAARPQSDTPALASVTLLAAETDFTEPGELGVLIDEAQVAALEAQMAEKGYLGGRQMAGSFTFLHARELYWAPRVRTYGLGEAESPNDLMAWNADVTRMPAAMHGEYLRRCYLHNEIAEGRFPVKGRPVALDDIRAPLFVVGTEKDHVSPWRSVYKIHRLTRTELTFVLTNGGHNAGIVSEPGHAGRHHAVLVRQPSDPVLDPVAWQAAAPRRDGSWWVTWNDWLVAHGSPSTVKARTPSVAAVVCDAPGRHVHMRYPEDP